MQLPGVGGGGLHHVKLRTRCLIRKVKDSIESSESGE